jgi:hypothetical protein
VISRFVVPTLLALSTVLIITFTVLIGGYAIAAATADASGAKAFWWVAIICLILLVVDCLMLLLVLAYVHVDASMESKVPESRNIDGEDEGPN